jgi:hypothetical protein
MKRRFALAVGTLIAVLSFWFIHSGIEARRTQVQRELAYQNQLQHFQRELRLGMPRSEVAAYLHSQKIQYNGIDQYFDVKIGEEPGGSIFCEKWVIYIEMGFSHLSGQTEPSPFDDLNSVSIRKIGTCL